MKDPKLNGFVLRILHGSSDLKRIIREG